MKLIGARTHGFSAPLLTAIVAWLIEGLGVAKILSVGATFSCLTLLLLVYNCIEIARVRRQHGQDWLLHPMLLGSLLTFCLPFGLDNMLFLLPDSTLDQVGLRSQISPAMVKIMWLALLGSVCLWLGYRSPIAARLTKPAVCRSVTRWLRQSDSPRSMALPALAGVALVARIVQIKLGVFGYSSNYNRLIEMAAVTQYLSMAASLGLGALIISSFDVFSQRSSERAWFWFALILANEVFFGILSGFKSQVAMPLVIVGTCKYLRSGRIPSTWLVGFVVALILAYGIIEPFRDYKAHDRGFNGTSLSNIVDGFKASRGESGGDSYEDAPIWLSVLARSSITFDGSLGIEYCDAHKTLPEGSPQFLSNILLAPAYAVMPRFLWANKPISDLGLWYTQVVAGKWYLESSTAMGPVTYLYFAGGILGVALGFMFFGAINRMLFLWIAPRDIASNAFVYLVMLAEVSQIDSSVDGMVVYLVRTVPLLLLVQRFAYRRTKPYRAPAFGLQEGIFDARSQYERFK